MGGVSLLTLALVFGALPMPQLVSRAYAQADQAGHAPASHAVVQALPDANDPGRELSGALTRLGRNPRDSEALISAGNAALAMGDTDAATGFLTRADKLAPGNPRVQGGLASAMIRSGDPVGALPLFDAAERGGALSADLMADRGLAYDLVGDNLSAQHIYRQALAMGANDEAMRRLGLSLAIAGDRRGMEATLSPLLQKQDRATWRVRAFAFAILGREEEAVAIAKATMPEDLSMGISPYLRYMRKLTPAQQAAAANLGQFPHASAIGQDEPRIAAYAAQHQLRRLASIDTPLVPTGEALGAKARGRDADKAAKRRRGRGDEELTANGAGGASAALALAANVAPPEPMPSRETQPTVAAQLVPVAAPPTKPAVGQAALPKPSAAKPAAAKPATVNPVVERLAAVEPIPARPAPARVMGPTMAEAEPENVGLPQVKPPPAPPVAVTKSVAVPPLSKAPVSSGSSGAAQGTGGFDLARITPGAGQPQVAAAANAPVTATPIASPPTERPVVAAPAAVAPPIAASATASAPAALPRKRNFNDMFSDLGTAKLAVVPAAGAVDMRKIVAPRPVPKAPPPPAHPSRIWVQLGVGRDTDKLAFDWRRMNREDPEIFRGRKSWTTDWVKTNRLLVGPFETEASAKAFNEKLHKADHPGTHVWVSPAGQVVDALDAG